MTLRWYLSTAPSTVVEITDRVRWPKIGIGAMANQDSWNGDLEVEDPDGDLVPLMFRRIYAIEDEAPAGAQNVGNWFISNLKIKRSPTAVGVQRTWVVTMADENSLLDRSIFDGTDSNRPEETDIARLRWFLTTTEGNFFDPDETYIDTTGPKTLDAYDLRQSTPKDMLSAMMAASGKHYWVMYNESLGAYVIWYANMNTSTLYTSTASLSNVATEVGDPATTLVYPLSGDAELDRAGGRMSYKLLAPYKLGFVTASNATFLSTYGKVDRVAPAPEVSSLARATAQVTRQLAELDVPDDEITTTWTADAASVNLIKHGMRLPVHVSHFPNYTDDSDDTLPGYLEPGYAAGSVWCRVMDESLQQPGGETITKVLRLSPQSVRSCSVSFTQRVSNQITDQAGASGSYAISVTPTAHSAIVAGFVAGGTGMSLGGTGFTTLDSYANTGHETFANGWAAASSIETVTASYSITGNPQAAVIAAFATSATAPVQTAVGTWNNGPLTASFASPPTPGNMLIAVVTGSANRDPMTLGPSSLWHLDDGLGHSLTFLDEGQCNGVHPFGGDAVAIFAGCVETGAGSDWTYGGTGAISNFFAVTIMEWAIS